MIYQKIKTETGTELKEISFEEAFRLAGTGDVLAFDSQTEELEFYKEVLKRYPHQPSEPREKKSNISEIIPYLDEEELHEIVLSFVNGDKDEEFKGLDLEEVFPYLDEEDADALFIKGITEEHPNFNPAELAPFVSEKAFAVFVDEYIKGNYQNVEIDELYPFMASADIKRLLKYYISKNK